MPDEQLTVQAIHGQDPAQHILRLVGALTMRSLFPLQDAVRADSSPVLILDLTGVSFVDSVGLGCLVGAFVSRQKDGRKLGLVGVNERVRGAMNIASLDNIFAIYPSIEEAQRTLR